MSKKAIVVLTRGYANVRDYRNLIKRNNSITFLSEPDIDILIFHEGNIPESHQKYISSFSLHLKLIFICISEHAFSSDKKQIKFYEPTKTFGLNYRHMCSFWFADFWNYVQEYDYILRIDEDCIINFNVLQIFYNLEYKNKSAIYGDWILDNQYVTLGLNKFTQNFINREISKEKILSHKASGPYTNVFGLNLKILRQNKLVMQYIESIKESNNIYIYRWGDLPLWGEALFYFCNPESYCKLNTIKYFHGSHNSYVGQNTKKINLNI
jgi:hypothetical protein